MGIREEITQSFSSKSNELKLCLALLTFFESQVEESLPFYMYAQIENRFPTYSPEELVQALDILAQPRFSALKKVYFIFLSDESIYEFSSKEIIEIVGNGYFENPETNKVIENLNEICFAYELGEKLLREAKK